MLLVGCHDAVRLYNLYIDDASELSQRRLAEAIHRVALGEDVSDSITLDQRSSTAAVGIKQNGVTGVAQPSISHSGENGNAIVGDRSADGGETSGSHHEDQHLTMQLLSRVRASPLPSLSRPFCVFAGG